MYIFGGMTNNPFTIENKQLGIDICLSSISIAAIGP